MNIGFIGIGQMGLGMVTNLLKNHHVVYPFDKDIDKVIPVIKNGGKKLNSINELVKKSEVIFLSLPHPKISQKVIFGQNGIIYQNLNHKIIIETSTLDPETVIKMDKKLSSNNINFLSTPIFGRPNDALNGELIFLIEGDKKIYLAYKNLLMQMGRKTIYMGKPPMATLTKLVKNLIKFSSMATGLEITQLLYKYSNDLKPIYKILIQSTSEDIWKKSIKSNLINNQKYNPSNTLIKDLQLIQKISKRKHVKMTLNQATLNYFSKLIDA